MTIFTGKSIITMDKENPRVEAVGVQDGKIKMVGSLNQVKSNMPDEEIINLGENCLMPAFVESHSHPLLSGLVTCTPIHYVFPLESWDKILQLFKRLENVHPLPAPFVFSGFDKLLHGVDAPKAKDLDEIFGKDRIAVVLDNSGHGVYFSTAAMINAGLDPTNPNVADLQGGHWGRNVDGTLDGQGFELPCVLHVVDPILKSEIPDPLSSAKQYYNLLARQGIVTASELTFATRYKPGYVALAMTPNVPLRICLYHMSTEQDCTDPCPMPADPLLIRKNGIKLWADGSPWVGNIAISFPYLDNDTTRKAGIVPNYLNPGTSGLNYTLEELKEILDDIFSKSEPGKWQMAFHCNGDLAIDVCLDAYEYALKKYNLLGTDHRWRLEHLGAGNRQLFKRAQSLGITLSMSPFQFYYWGDLLDGKMFESKIGSQWQQFKSAFDEVDHVSFHNDGAASPPSPLINIQTAISRTTKSGKVHGLEQAITLQQALEAETIHPAYQLFMDKEIGSITPGKLADFVILSKDPFNVKDYTKFAMEVQVVETWMNGKKVDLEAFLKSQPVMSKPEPIVKDDLVSVGNTVCCGRESLPRPHKH